MLLSCPLAYPLLRCSKNSGGSIRVQPVKAFHRCYILIIKKIFYKIHRATYILMIQFN